MKLILIFRIIDARGLTLLNIFIENDNFLLQTITDALRGAID
jgi:hypothetical protein